MKTEKGIFPAPFLLLFGRLLRKANSEQVDSEAARDRGRTSVSSVKTRITEIRRETTDDD
jgi:hypothetical protein